MPNEKNAELIFKLGGETKNMSSSRQTYKVKEIGVALVVYIKLKWRTTDSNRGN